MRKAGTIALEVDPHAAYVALFAPPSIIRYKKGMVTERVSGPSNRSAHARAIPFAHDAALGRLLNSDPATMRGRARKSFDDSLDALFCAYLAFHFSRYGMSACRMFGNHAAGYILNPATPVAQLAVPAP